MITNLLKLIYVNTKVLKLHDNTLNSNYSKIFKKCLRLLMTSTLGYYKKLLFRCYENYNSQLESVRINWSDKSDRQVT